MTGLIGVTVHSAYAWNSWNSLSFCEQSFDGGGTHGKKHGVWGGGVDGEQRQKVKISSEANKSN